MKAALTMGERRYCGLPAAAVVVAASTIINMIYGGSYYCSGLLFYHWMHTFSQTKARTAVIVSLMNGVMYATGLVAGPLTMQYGPRPVAVAGAILSGLGLLISAFAQKLWVLYMSYGILTGFGWGCLLTTAAVSVQQHTNKRRAFAAGISFTGTALGNLMYPLMFRLLESTFGWRGALLIMAGLQLNCLPAGLLLLPPPPALPDESVSPDALDTSEEQALSTGQAPEEGELDKVYNQDGQIPRQEKLHSKPVVNINGQVSIGKSPYALDASEKQGLTSRTENLTAQGHISELDVVLYIDGKIPRKEMLHTGPAPVHINGQVSNEEKPHTKLDANSTLNNQKSNEKLPVDSKARSLTDHPQPDASLEYHKDLPSQLTTTNLTDGNVMLTYSTASGITDEKHVQYKQRKGNCCTQLIMKLRKAAKDGKQRLRSCGFASLACVIAYICRYSGMSVLYAFLPMKVVSVGLPPDTAAYLMSILSMGELVGRIGVTATAWLHNRLPLIYFVVAAVLAGILEAVMGFTQTLMPMVVIVSILGLNAGVLSCIATTVVRDTVGITNLPWVLGLASGAAGISNLSSIQLLAWIWQETGSISILFLIAGSSLVCAGLSFVVYHGCQRAHKPRYP